MRKTKQQRIDELEAKIAATNDFINQLMDAIPERKYFYSMNLKARKMKIILSTIQRKLL